MGWKSSWIESGRYLKMKRLFMAYKILLTNKEKKHIYLEESSCGSVEKVHEIDEMPQM